MPETEVKLSRPLPMEQAAELERQIHFVSPDILSFRFLADAGVVHTVLLRTTEKADHGSLSTKLNSLIGIGPPELPPTKPRVIWRSRHHATTPEDVFPRLTSAGLAIECGEGQMALAESLISLQDALDRRIHRLLAEAFDVATFQYPTLIPSHVLDSTGYATAFPQFLMFVTRLHADVDVYREFLDTRHGTGSLDEALLTHCRNVDYCLPPAMCFHTFGQYRNRSLEPGRMHTVTSRGKVFRHESRYARTLERLWDFTVREVVFLGSRHEVLEARERLMSLVFRLVEELDLDGRCEIANDSFFGGPQAPAKAWSQRQLELKYELRLSWAPEADLAVGSFNFHDNFFGERFGITRADIGPVSSSCAGFGLERLVYAVLCQHGQDPRGWPSAVRALLNRVPEPASDSVRTGRERLRR